VHQARPGRGRRSGDVRRAVGRGRPIRLLVGRIDNHGRTEAPDQRRDSIPIPDVESVPLEIACGRGIAVERRRDSDTGTTGLLDDFASEQASTADHKKIHRATL
jgi:hypothetical protein